MIRNEQEYQEASERLAAEEERIELHRKGLVSAGLKKAELKRAMDPLISFHQQLREEVEHYENLKRGKIPDLTNLHGLGVLLVSLRIAKGMSQRELASLLGVHDSQVSRDERNEYHGITVERATMILEAMGVTLTSTITQENPDPQRASS
jgi:ribosome-binding protein aMBF1 (putative translation factor)